MARLTPYELVFTAGDFESRVFPRIRAEAAREKVDPRFRERFDFLTTAADVVRSMVSDDAPPDALEQYRALLYHAFHYWNRGRRLYLLEAAVARYLVEAAPTLEGWEFVAPADSLYLQLPANLFWTSVTPESTPEPVDGFFVAFGEGEDAWGKPFSTLEALAILGVRSSRAGFSIVPLQAEIGEGIAGIWADAEDRDGGDFTSLLPGGEIAGLYSLVRVAEVLKLLARSFWYIDRYPEALALEPAAGPPDPEAGRTARTRLAFTRVTLRPEGESAEGPES